jgi:hypothetical protein
MSATISPPFPAPQIGPQPTASKWEQEYQAFQRILPRLLPTHRNQYVLVHEGQVVDSGPDDVELALRFFAKHGNIPIHIGLVTDQPPPVARIPHYRERVLPGPTK